MTSSTSSSEGRRQLPWGADWCLVFFVAVELGFRLLPASFFLTFDQNDYGGGDDTIDYPAVNLAIELLPPPEVMVIGTSRAREGIQSPVLERALEASLGRAVEVRNYSTAGGRVDISLALLERLVSEDHLPRVMVVGLDGSDFRDEDAKLERVLLMDLATLGADIERNGWPSETDVTHILGNSLPLRMVLARLTLRYRLVKRGDWTAEEAFAGNPASGGVSQWGRIFAEQMKTRAAPPKMKVVPRRVKMTINGYKRYERALERLHELVELAAAHDVRLVLAEIPPSPAIREDPEVVEVQTWLRGAISALADGRCVKVWTAESSLDHFSRRQYRDPSHLNGAGAAAFVDLVAPAVAEALGDPGDGRACAR